MKELKKLWIAAACGLLLLSGCKKEQEVQVPEQEQSEKVNDTDWRYGPGIDK